MTNPELRQSSDLIKPGRSPLHFIAGIAVVAFFIYVLNPVIPALIISCLLFIALEPVVGKLCLNGMSATQASLIIIIALVFAFTLGIYLGLEPMIKQLEFFYNHINSIKYQVGQQLMVLNRELIESGYNVKFSGLKELTTPSTFNMNMELLQSGSSIVLSIASYLILVPLILFFLLKDYRHIRNVILGFLPNRYFELGWLVYYRVTNQLQRYFRGVILQVCILTIVASTGFYFIGLPSFFIMGLCAGLLVVVPYLGMFLAMAIPIILYWSVSPGDYLMVFKIVLVVSIAYLHDQIVVIPTVIASAVNLHPLIIIIGIVLFGYYLGILGMVIAVPVLATAKIITESLLNGLQNRVDVTL